MVRCSWALQGASIQLSARISRLPVAITTEKDAEDKKTEMGRKNIVPYALYRAEGYISANLAKKSHRILRRRPGTLWQAIINMFEIDHSAARGENGSQRTDCI